MKLGKVCQWCILPVWDLRVAKSLEPFLLDAVTDDMRMEHEMNTDSEFDEYGSSEQENQPVVANVEETDDWSNQEEYPLSLTKEDFKKYLLEVEIPDHPRPMKMLKGMMELGGEASCKQLSDVYGGSPSRYNACGNVLGKRMTKYFNLQDALEEDKFNVNSIPFLRRVTTYKDKKVYSWKIRDNLLDALKELDLSHIDPYVDKNDVVEQRNNAKYWMYTPGSKASEWERCLEEQVMVLGWPDMKDLRDYDSREDMRATMTEIYGTGSYTMDSLATWEFSHSIQVGDVVFAKKGRNTILGKGIVTSEYYYEPERGDFPHVLGVQWLKVGEWRYTNGLLEVKTLTAISPEKGDRERLDSLVNGRQLEEKYTDEDFLNDVFMPKEKLAELKDILEEKKNIILQGPPGVGKTFSAKRLAYAIMGVKDDDYIQVIQFHQNYSYEDFIMGYKPTEAGGFELKNGVFMNFCEAAAGDTSHKYFFIIDEINRGNLSKIFGELMMVIEGSYRNEKVRLAYKNEEFSVPENLYLIGMMNTADRSLALIDYALRRRFSFITMEPGFDTEGFKKRQSDIHNESFDKLVEAVKKLNEYIKADGSLGKGFCIGHSYFCSLTPENCTKRKLMQIVNYDLIPTLEEYWFDNAESLIKWQDNLRNAVK